jgi:hypothetical protein
MLNVINKGNESDSKISLKSKMVFKNLMPIK